MKNFIILNHQMFVWKCTNTLKRDFAAERAESLVYNLGSAGTKAKKDPLNYFLKSSVWTYDQSIFEF